MGWDRLGLVLIQKGLSLPSVGHFTCSADCCGGLHPNKACLIPLPSVTSHEPVRKSGDGDNNESDATSESHYHVGPLTSFSFFIHLPEVADMMQSTGFKAV